MIKFFLTTSHLSDILTIRRKQTMAIKERPLTINGITFNNYEEFRNYVMSHRASKEEVIRSVEEDLKFYENKYKMSTKEFIEKIAGTPADDEPDFIVWLSNYDTYKRLTNGKE
jgi:Rad3-related DNA helicase